MPRLRSLLWVGVVVGLAATACTGDDPTVVDPDESPTAPASPTPTDGTSPTGSPEDDVSPTGEERVPVEDVRLGLEPVAEGLEAPLLVTAPDGDDRLYVVEQAGRVQVVEDGEARTMLDLTDRVSFRGEQGLLGLAFHPDYADNGRLFVDFTDTAGTTHVEEFTADPAAATVDPDSRRTLLTVEQPAANHNGGMVAFGPDGMLHVALGDGGGAADQFGNGQRPDTVLGTLLRLDVDGGDPYGIPPDNPFADGGDGAPEVWAYGLRNPWRFTFDAGRLYVADVGQNRIEEVNVVADDAAGLNYGWPVLEGDQCFEAEDCDRSGLVEPAVTYPLDGGACAVIGGFVYRGAAIPGLTGHYLYGDLCAGFVRSFRMTDDGPVDRMDWTEQLGEPLGRLTSFGVDAAGELYVTTEDGLVARIVPA